MVPNESAFRDVYGKFWYLAGALPKILGRITQNLCVNETLSYYFTQFDHFRAFNMQQFIEV